MRGNRRGEDVNEGEWGGWSGACIRTYIHTYIHTIPLGLFIGDIYFMLSLPIHIKNDIFGLGQLSTLATTTIITFTSLFAN